jgi:hypothetical protein
MIYLAWFTFLYWLIRGADLIIGTLFCVPRLSAVSEAQPHSVSTPKISVILAARNESKHIGDAVRKLLLQNYPNFELITVNDRSDDDTLSILQAIQDPRLKVVDITTLPKGWLGKTHALYQAYLASSGEWLLFTDADVKFDPATLRDAIDTVQQRSLDHLALFPKVELVSYLETIFVAYFTLTFNMRFRTWAARFRRSRAFVGIGAFNLVRRTAYEKIGTHKSIALDIADDMMLGKRIKQAGFRQMGMNGDRHISVRWVEGARGVMNSLHKNGFRGLNYNLLHLIVISCGMLVVDTLPFIGLFFAHGDAFYLFAGTVLCVGLVYGVGALYVPATILAYPAHPFGSLLFMTILWRSAISAIRDGGVGWRGTMYSLEELKKNSTPL